MELISVNLSWDTYLRRMAMEGEWGDWIALWGLINILQIQVAIETSLGGTGLKVIYPAGCQNGAHLAMKLSFIIMAGNFLLTTGLKT